MCVTGLSFAKLSPQRSNDLKLIESGIMSLITNGTSLKWLYGGQVKASHDTWMCVRGTQSVAAGRTSLTVCRANEMLILFHQHFNCLGSFSTKRVSLGPHTSPICLLLCLPARLPGKECPWRFFFQSYILHKFPHQPEERICSLCSETSLAGEYLSGPLEKFQL